MIVLMWAILYCLNVQYPQLCISVYMEYVTLYELQQLMRVGWCILSVNPHSTNTVIVRIATNIEEKLLKVDTRSLPISADAHVIEHNEATCEPRTLQGRMAEIVAYSVHI